MMAEAQGDDDDDIFVFMGGDQRVPDEVRRARIHKSVKIVRALAFHRRWELLTYIEFHDGVEIIEEHAFTGCWRLKGPIKLLGVKIIKNFAFGQCDGLTAVEFGDHLETIEASAFTSCEALKKIRMPSVRTIGVGAFASCYALSEVECGEGLRTIQEEAFRACDKLERIALPLKDGIIRGGVFYRCPMLTAVHLVGGIHQTVASLQLESWRSQMIDEINRINQILPTTDYTHKTPKIQQWMESSFHQLDHYKSEHHQMLKEATTLLELALWKANLDDNGGDRIDREGIRTTRGSRKRARKEICVTSGASIVIKNVLPFLALK